MGQGFRGHPGHRCHGLTGTEPRGRTPINFNRAVLVITFYILGAEGCSNGNQALHRYHLAGLAADVESVDILNRVTVLDVSLNPDLKDPTDQVKVVGIFRTELGLQGGEDTADRYVESLGPGAVDLN